MTDQFDKLLDSQCRLSADVMRLTTLQEGLLDAIKTMQLHIEHHEKRLIIIEQYAKNKEQFVGTLVKGILFLIAVMPFIIGLIGYASYEKGLYTPTPIKERPIN